MKNHIYTLLVVLLFSVTTNAQDQPVYWLHGFQLNPFPTSDQSPGRWDLYSTKFQNEREIQSFVPNFARNRAEVENGIANAANVLAGRMTNNSNSVIIGHSMGGLVARRLDANNNRTIGGIVSVGAVHNGALIATNLQNGKILASARKGFNELTKGPASTTISVVFPFTLGRLNPKGITNLFWDNVLETYLMNQLPPTNSATLRDLMPGSTFLNDLNSRNTRVPFINVTITEKDHEALRMGASALAHPEEQPLHSHDDSGLNSARTKTESWYKAGKDFYLAYRWTQLWRFNSLTRKANYYKAGETYLDHGFETDYNSLNGGSTYEQVTATRIVWRCGDNVGTNTGVKSIGALPAAGDCLAMQNSSECADCRWITETYTTYRTVKYSHDGLATTKAQDAKINSFNSFRATTVNHMEVGNHSEMTSTLNEIFGLTRTVFYRQKR
jgi:pimeloyl-ACP methyl ester carboxylesterase